MTKVGTHDRRRIWRLYRRADPGRAVPAVQQAVAEQYEAKTGIKELFTFVNHHKEQDSAERNSRMAPDGQPYRLLTLRNNAGMVSR